MKKKIVVSKKKKTDPIVAAAAKQPNKKKPSAPTNNKQFYVRPFLSYFGVFNLSSGALVHCAKWYDEVVAWVKKKKGEIVTGPKIPD